MKISGIDIQNTFGTVSFKAGNFTALRVIGENGSGKSSILRSLAYLFEGGCDPSVIRRGAEQSVVEMALSDGTKISKTTRPKRARKGGEVTGYVADLEVTSPDGTPKPAPKSFLDDLGRALAIDPSTILRLDTSTAPGRKALADQLQKLVPIAFEPDEIRRACAYRSTMDIPRGAEDALALPAEPQAALTLDDLKKAAASVTEQRRREGQIRSDTEGAISRLQKALPESCAPVAERHGAGKAAAADEAALRKLVDESEEYRRTVEAAIADARREVEKAKGETIAAITSAWSTTVQAINADIDAKIRALEAERSERTSKARDERDKAKEAAEADAVKSCADIDAESKPELEKAIAGVTQAKDAIAAYARAATLREEIEVQEGVHKAAAWRYDQLSEVLQRIESLRLDKLQHLPIAGLVVEDGLVYLDEIPWQNVNTARKVEAVIQICCLQSGKLPLILWDDAEHADSEMSAAIESGLRDAGYQVISARVSDGPLKIETINEPVMAGVA